MSEDGAGRAARDALIREGISLLAVALMLWYFGPGKIVIGGLRHRAVSMYRARGDRIDSEIAKFRAEVSRWEHEQAAG